MANINHVLYSGSNKIISWLCTTVNWLIDHGGGGGSTVAVDTILTDGINIADITVDQTLYHLFAPEGGGSSGTSEVISITNGDNTTTRTFAFSRQPKFIKIYYKSPSLGWCTDTMIVWGQDYYNYLAHTIGVNVSGGSGGIGSASYNGNSVTLMGGNAFGAFNNADGDGYLFVEY